MKKTKYRLKSLSVVVVLLLLQACATNGYKEPRAKVIEPVISETVQKVQFGRTVNQPLLLIAVDFVRALSQVPELNAKKTTIEVLRDISDFDIAVKKALVAKGYKIRVVQKLSGNNSLLTSVIRNTSSADNSVFTHVVGVDRIVLKRSYSIRNREVSPTSSLFVRGVNASSIQLDDRMFVSPESWPG